MRDITVQKNITCQKETKDNPFEWLVIILINLCSNKSQTYFAYVNMHKLLYWRESYKLLQWHDSDKLTLQDGILHSPFLIEPHFDCACISWYPDIKQIWKINYTMLAIHELVSAKLLLLNIMLGQINSEGLLEYWKRITPSNINELFTLFWS